MSKPTLVVSCPIDTYSGYGARSRDFVQSIIDLDKYDVMILPQRWGNTRFGYLQDHNNTLLSSKVVSQLTQQPDVWIQITVPNEFQKVGKYNIGLTAGIETTMCDPSWIQGCNNMDLVLVSSKHARKVFMESKFDMQDNRTGQVTQHIELQTKVEVLFEGADIEKYTPLALPVRLDLSEVDEAFNYLVVGHWLPGEVGEDRKNIGYTIKAFLETFKNKPKAKRPGLILKVQAGSGTSIMDRDAVLDKIDAIRKTVKGDLPNIYVLHGDLSDAEMNELYNHTKVKAMITLTKGEGFGRPLLEFSLVNKPIIASFWSGHTDFLDSEFVKYVGGNLTPVHPSAAVDKMILRESQWFTPDAVEVGRALKDVYDDYDKWKTAAKRQGHKSRTLFSYESMRETLDNLLTLYVPDFPKQVQLKLPQLKKIELPKLKKSIMEEKLIDCPHCGSNACYEQQVSEEVSTNFCFGCGFTTSTLMVEGSKLVADSLENSPELYKDLMFVDENKKVWFPSTITIPNKGMVFLDGTAKDSWRWAAAKSIEILEEEKAKFPKEQTHKMDMKNIQYFTQKDFMDALDTIGFFDVEVAQPE